MEVQNLIADIATLTTIPVSSLDKLATKASYCICNSVETMVLNKDDTVYIDIGVGRLGIQIDGNEIKYKFIPSSSLENSIKETILRHHNPLVNALEKSLVSKIINTYKDLF